MRSTRESVCRSILKGEALTLEQYRVAETRDLVGSGITNAPVEAMPIAYDGPHQFRWDPGSWQGFVELSASRKINNSNDTYDPDWEYRSEFDWPGSTIDDEVLADEDTLTPSYEDYVWPEDWDVYDRMDDTFGGSDLTEEGLPPLVAITGIGSLEQQGPPLGVQRNTTAAQTRLHLSPPKCGDRRPSPSRRSRPRGRNAAQASFRNDDLRVGGRGSRSRWTVRIRGR